MKFRHNPGPNYVSCSSKRLPVARLYRALNNIARSDRRLRVAYRVTRHTAKSSIATGVAR